MKLPPMNALRAFEAVSRLGSVSKAADELCVSQGAVSQQLRNLEDHLGQEMFIRTPNSFTLSEDGEDFAEVVQQSLGEIALAAGKVKREKTQGTLTISTGAVLGDKWLIQSRFEGDFTSFHRPAFAQIIFWTHFAIGWSINQENIEPKKILREIRFLQFGAVEVMVHYLPETVTHHPTAGVSIGSLAATHDNFPNDRYIGAIRDNLAQLFRTS